MWDGRVPGQSRRFVEAWFLSPYCLLITGIDCPCARRVPSNLAHPFYVPYHSPLKTPFQLVSDRHLLWACSILGEEEPTKSSPSLPTENVSDIEGYLVFPGYYTVLSTFLQAIVTCDAMHMQLLSSAVPVTCEHRK